MIFREALELEIVQLEQALQADPRFQKLQELRRIQRLYNPTMVDHFTNFLAGAARFEKVVVKDKPTSRDSTQVSSTGRREILLSREAMMSSIEGLLQGRTNPTSTAEIYDEVVKLGHQIGGRDPKNNLSAILSRSEQFQSHGRAGWTLSSELPSTGGEAANSFAEVEHDPAK